jgi:translocation and assembly module TamA
LKKARLLSAAVALGALALANAAHAQTAARTPPPRAPSGTQPAPVPGPNDPIVPDSQFEEALPPLDPDLARPLEPLDQVDPVRPFPPVPGPIEEAPLGDPALAEPLPPLSTFEAQPVADASAGREGDDDESEPVRVNYTLVVEGLDEVGLTGRFRDLSALQDARGEAVNGAQIAQRAREDEDLAIRLLRSEGYYDAVAAHAIEQLPGEGDAPGALRVVISAVPGQRYNFGEIRIDSTPLTPPILAREALPLTTGRPIVAIDVEAAEANVLLRLPQEGYPFPELGLRDILLDPETGTGDYTLPLNPGPRARFGGFTTEGDLAFGPRHVGRLARFRRGEIYDRRMVDDLREAMVATRLFTGVSAEAVRTGELAEDGTEYVNVLVRQDAGPARSIDGSAGFSTGEGFRIEGAWEHRNLFPPEGSLRVNAVAGTQEQSIGARFRRNNWGERDRALLFQFEAGRRDYAAFRGYTTRILGLVTRESTPIWQKRWTYAFGAELLATNESRFGEPNLSLGDAFFIGGLIGQLGYDRSNSLLDPTRGFRLLARINPKPRFATGSTATPATSSKAAPIFPPATISSSPAASGWDRSTASSGTPSRPRGASMPAAAARCAASATSSSARARSCRTPISTRRTPKRSRRPSRSRSAGAASTNSRSRAATASAITASSPSSMPARSMKANIRPSTICASASASAAGSTPISAR